VACVESRAKKNQIYNAQSDKRQGYLKNDSIPTTPKNNGTSVMNHFGSIIPTGTPLHINPKITKKRFLSPAEPIATGVLPSTELVNNVIPFVRLSLELPLSSLKQQTIKKHYDTTWVVNTIGDTLPTGHPYRMVGERKQRVQLPRQNALAPRYKNTLVPFDIKSLDVTSGLLTSYVYCVFQDSQKRIWVGSYNGLSMYDGQNFTHYTKEQGLASNLIYTISEDLSGNILIGTRGDGTKGGLSVYDGLSFTNISEKEGLPHHFITSIYPDIKGGYWLGTPQGAIYYNGTTYTLFSTAEGLPHNNIRAITGDDMGTIYFATAAGLALFDGTNFRYLTQNDGLKDNSIQALFLDSTSRLWIGSQNGLHYYKDDMLYQISDVQDKIMGITEIVEDQDGSIWIASSESGLFEYRNNQLYGYSEEQGLINENLQSLYVDNDNHLWLASDGGGLGIFRHDSFSYLTQASSIGTPSYHSLMEDHQKNIWIGSNSSGVTILKEHLVMSLNKTKGLLSNSIEDIEEDSQGTVWIATPKALSAFKDNTITNYTIDQGLSSNSVRCVYVDNQQQVWAGTTKGITIFTEDEIHYYNEENGFLHNTINDIITDREGSIWIATNAGLARYDGAVFTFYSEAEGLSENTINTLFIDSTGLLWIGTLGGGISTFNGEQFKTYTANDGISDNVIWSLQEDRNNTLWATTEKGLTTFTPQTQNTTDEKPYLIHSYFESDGLPELSFFQGDALLDSKGMLWLSNVANITKKSPKNPNQTPSYPSIRLNRIELNDTFYDFNAIQQQDSLPFKYSKSLPFYNIPLDLVAEPSQKQCSFFFSAIDWIAPHNLQFSHTIEELNQGWSKPSLENKADYRNLNYGSYTFKLKAIGSSGIWSPEYTYRFTILPPWWHTWWARVCYALVAILLVYSYIKLRLRNLKKRQKELLKEVETATREIRLQKEEIELQKTDLEEANTMKNRMFSVIAHDLRGPFGQLKMGLMLLEEGNLSPEERTEITAMLNRDHVNTSALLDNLLKWSIAQKGEMIYEPTTHAIQPLVAENIGLLSKEAVRKEVRLFNKVPDSLTAYFDKNMIQTVLRNLMSNAIKFTQVGDRITIDGKRIGDFVSISVEDTGVGIPEDKVNKLFKKNKNFTTYGTDNEKGSGLGLELCYELVVKNRGTIVVSSVEGEGTTIVFELPTDP